MTLREIGEDVLRKAWIEIPALAPDYLYADAAIALNQAVQTIWLSRNSDEIKRQVVTVAITPGTARYALPDTVQRVLSPVRLGTVALREAGSLGDIEAYAVRYLGASAESGATPQAYWVESLAKSGEDSASAYLHLAPTPIANGTVTLQAVLNAPIYTSADLQTDDSPGVPHAYVASLLLPLARYYMTRSHFFGQETHRAALETDAAAALEQYGMAVPWRPEATRRESTPVPA